MKNPTNNKRRIILRYAIFVGIMLMFSICIVFKLFKTTVVYAGAWNEKADSILTKISIIEPDRGTLMSDNGQVLAANIKFNVARIDWSSEGIQQDTLKKYLPALCDSLAVFEPSRTSEQWQKEITSAYEKTNAKGKKSTSYRLIRRLLTNKEMDRLRSFPYFNKGKKKSGFYSDPVVKRTKPNGMMAARSIGNVGEVKNKKGLHGISGIEGALDTLLYGIPGKSTKLQLTSSIVNVAKEPAVPGYDITTTINVDMQDILENELYSMCVESKARWATAILMEVSTGEIKAISNLDLDTKTGEYNEDINHAVLPYEPGSVMKPISMLVAMEDGIVNSSTQAFATGSSYAPYSKAKPVTDHYPAASLTTAQIIARSSNVGISRIICSKYLSNPDGFRQRLEQLGFFEPFNSGIAGEQVPVFQKLGNTNADHVALTRMAFGYTTLIPPMRTLAIFNAIANDGKYVRPHLMKKLSRAGEPDSIIPVSYVREQICTPQHAQSLREMLHAVVWDEGGTARKFLQDDKVEIAGKTGTAFTNEGGSYTGAKRYAFCGFFPYSNPKYSCMVLMMGADRGAAACSGMVLKNTALKMYARGMLGNESTYIVKTDAHGNAKNEPKKPAVIYSNNAAAVSKDLGINKPIVYKAPAQPKTGVPNVIGLSMREAIEKLERKGLVVRFKGTGYVAGQSMSPGTQYKRGDNIMLTLAHK